MRISRTALSIVLAAAVSLPLMGSASAAAPLTSDGSGSLGENRLLVSERAGDQRRTVEMDPADGAVTHTVADGLDGVYSPSGSQIAYIRYGNTCVPQAEGCTYRPDLVTATASGANQRVLAPGVESETGEVYIANPDWAPNGKRVVFDTPRGIESVNADGTGRETLTTSGLRATFSPDGSRIAYLRATSYEGPEGTEYGTDVYVMDLATRESRQVTTDHQAVSTPPDWSPDGRHLVFSGTSGLKAVDTVTGEQSDLYDSATWATSVTDVRTPVYSPDGTRIAFSGWDDTTATRRLYLVDADGTHLRAVADTGGTLTDWIGK